jgi:hypothetical protein
MTEILEHVMGEITETTVDLEIRSSGKVYNFIYSSLDLISASGFAIG